jgi:hypothetical protein
MYVTEATGSQNQNNQPSEGAKSPPPWERTWNTIAGTTEEAKAIVKKAVTPEKGFPWERDWSAKEKPQKPRVATTEGSWDDINKKYAAGHDEREKARLILLESELAGTHHQPTREALKREIKRVKNG